MILTGINLPARHSSPRSPEHSINPASGLVVNLSNIIGNINNNINNIKSSFSNNHNNFNCYLFKVSDHKRYLKALCKNNNNM